MAHSKNRNSLVWYHDSSVLGFKNGGPYPRFQGSVLGKIYVLVLFLTLYGGAIGIVDLADHHDDDHDHV